MSTAVFCKKLLTWIVSLCLLVATGSLISAYFVYQHLIVGLPDINSLRHVQYQLPLTIYSKENLLIAQFGEKKRIPVEIENVPQQLIHAFLAAEDDSFYEHPGVDVKSLLRAAWQLILTGKKKQGGSTITMQVTRNFLLSNEKTYTRKLKEIILALKIDHKLSKDQILELYLNQIFMGHRAYGVAAAAQVYFGKTLSTLTLAEHAMIAGLPKAPSLFNPINNLARAIERRNYVLQRMLVLKYISQEEYDIAIQQPSTAKLQKVTADVSAPYLAEMVRQKIYDEYGESAYTLGLKVYTTIAANLQKAANNALANTLHAYDERHGYRLNTSLSNSRALIHNERISTIGDTIPGQVISLAPDRVMIRLQNHTNIELPRENMKWAGDQLEKTLKIGDILRVRKLKNNAWKLAQVPKVEGAFVALNATNGAILALTGGFDFQRNKYNRATQSKRQPGSGFKPIIYSAALEEGYTPASMINDAPLVIDIAGQETEWRPENYNRKFLGPTSLRAAIAHSRNIISIRLLNEIGIDKAIKTAMRFGFSEEQLPKSLSLALGSGYASPLQMARVYAAFANGGFLVEPYFIERIEAPKGDIIYQAKPKIACAECNINYASPNSYAPRVLSADINFLMNSMLRDVVQKGTAIKAKNLNRQDLAGKTGTTNEQRDAWFNGFVPTIASTAWVGFDDFTPLGEHETGGTAALPMWIEFMQTALQETPEKPFEAPQGVIKAFINPATGLLASEKSSAGVWEFFQIEHQPNKVAKPGIDTAPETSHQDVIEALF